MSETVTLRLDLDVRETPRQAGQGHRSQPRSTAAEAGRQYVELNEWQIAVIQDGLRDTDNGWFIDRARLKSKWEKRLALARDKAH